ncbi:cytochrome b/b6 domain-containing protein [Polynucleobacter brandtiae]|uniref:Cytochrome b n=1 Tax=Polynucleobacter brandtiae TaxID=1938816 RepID=A0A2M8VZL4_9BURK|nr:cytochrome b/b6 domain-containing protein [Polynucleobacter brandtiae]PJI83284.1 cytochrome b [Polynucleobacter brandtiae]
MKKIIRIWDLPIRLFHWALLIFIIISFVTVNVGGDAMALHALSGYCILTLIIFRILWGFFGSHHARFVSFVPSPRGLYRYLKGQSPAVLGHNPLGSLSVLALIFSIGLQAVTGLFSNDDILFEGPFAKYVSNATVAMFNSIHHWNDVVLLGLIGVHLGAIFYYQRFRHESLIKPMLFGDKEIDPSEEAKYLPASLGQDSKDGAWQRGTALLVLSLIGVILGYFITR